MFCLLSRPSPQHQAYINKRRKKTFPFSQVEELYESYCLQKRLRDGASKMVKAYTSSAGSKEARESLAEASKGHKEYTEVGWQGLGK